MSNTNYLVVKDKVHRFANQFFNQIELREDGSLSIPFESTNIHVEIHDTNDSEADVIAFRKENDISLTTVSVWAMVLLDVKGSNELFKWIATEGQTFLLGGFKLVLRDDGLYNVIFQFNIPGDNLDAGELKGALAAVAITADNNDEELQSKFGGKTINDYRK